VALCRANDIPAREVWGIARSFDRRARNPKIKSNFWFGDHVWAEVYFPGPGWLPIEPQTFFTVAPPALGCVRLCHYDLLRGNPLRASSTALNAHPPAVERVRSLPDMPVRDAAVLPG
jgi:hypothetical protein